MYDPGDMAHDSADDAGPGWSAQATAEALGISQRTVLRAIARGVLPAVKYAGSYHIHPDDVARYRRRLRRRGDGAIPVAAVQLLPASSLTLPPLPVPMTSFVGREALVAGLGTILVQPETRLLTLIGPGGVGKTRLAIQAAGAVAGAFADGVGFIPLAAVRDPAALAPMLAVSLGLREGDEPGLLTRLQAHLAGWRCLLVLDNFEQIVEAAPLLAELTAACPLLTLLVTSRAPLRVGAERVWPVPTLAVSDGSDADAAAAEAVQLFLARARAIRPELAVTDATLSAIANLCARLDGLPLAIELAAARSNIFTPAALLSRLDHRLSLLSGGPRDLPQRHQTMQGAIAWSYDLLSQEEQTVFRWLAIFVGGFSFEAAAAMTGNGEVDLLQGLSTLVDHCLVQSGLGPGDEARFTMLETVREYGLEQLSLAGEHDDAGARHARFFLRQIQAIDPDLNAPDQAHWFDRLDADRANLQAALAWFLANRDAEASRRLAASPWQYWEMRGYLSQGRDWLEAALALPGAVDPVVTAAAHWRLGYFSYDLGDLAKAQVHFAESLACYESAGNRWGMASALNGLGLVAGDRSDLAAAGDYHERALVLRRETDDLVGIATSLGNLGNVALALGDYARSRARHEEALNLRRRIGRPRGIAYQSGNLGRLALSEERFAEAEEHLQQAVTLFEELGDQIGLAFATRSLALVAAERGAHDRTIAYCVRSLGLHRRLGLQRGMIECLETIACALVSLDPTLTVQLLAAADTLRLSTDTQRERPDEAWCERALAVARGTLGPPRYAAAIQHGQGLTLAAATAEANAALAAIADRHPAAAPVEASAPQLRGEADPRLSVRELEVLRLMAEGMSNRAISDALFVSPATVKRHVTNILAKIGVTSRAAAVTYVHRAGLDRPQ